MTQLQSYNNNPTIKTQLVAAMIADKEKEKLVKGHYFEGGKGCNIGCAEFELCQILEDKFTDTKHKYLAEKLQIPEFLLHLADTIFEGLPDEQSQKWAGADFWEAIPVGKDMSLLENKIKIEILINPKFGCYQYATEEIKAIIDCVVDLHKAKIEGKDWDESAAEAARSAAGFTGFTAWSAGSSAGSSAWSAAWSAAGSAAGAARSAAEAAADSAWAAAKSSAAKSSAEADFYIQLSKKIIELIKES